MSPPSPSQQPCEPAEADLAGLRREVAWLREILDLNSDWIWEVDASGRYTYCIDPDGGVSRGWTN